MIIKCNKCYQAIFKIFHKQILIYYSTFYRDFENLSIFRWQNFCQEIFKLKNWGFERQLVGSKVLSYVVLSKHIELCQLISPRMWQDYLGICCQRKKCWLKWLWIQDWISIIKSGNMGWAHTAQGGYARLRVTCVTNLRFFVIFSRAWLHLLVWGEFIS